MRARAVLVALAAGLLAGCETTAGFGRDVETAGVAIQREVRARRAPAPTVTPGADVYVAPPPGAGGR